MILAGSPSRTRTGMPSLAEDFKSPASAIPPRGLFALNSSWLSFVCRDRLCCRGPIAGPTRSQEGGSKAVSSGSAQWIMAALGLTDAGCSPAFQPNARYDETMARTDSPAFSDVSRDPGRYVDICPDCEVGTRPSVMVGTIRHRAAPEQPQSHQWLPWHHVLPVRFRGLALTCGGDALDRRRHRRPANVARVSRTG